MMKRLAWLAGCAAIVHLFAQETSWQAYLGYYGYATVRAKECTVTAINPFKLLPPKGK